MLRTPVVLATTATVFILTAGAFSLTQERDAESTVPDKNVALIRVARQTPTVWPSTTERVESPDEYFNLLKTHARLLKSQFVINAALTGNDELKALAKQASGKQDPADWLADQLYVTTDDGELVALGLRNAAIASPSQRAKLVNAVLDAYMMEVVNAEREQVLTRKNSIELALQKARREQQDKSHALAERRRQEGFDLKEIKLRVGEQRLAEVSRRRDVIALHKLALEADRSERLGTNQKEEPMKDVPDETVRGLDSQIRADDYQITQIDSQITLLYDQLSKLQAPSIDLDSRSHELEQNQVWLDQLAVRLRELTLSLQAASRVSIFQRAEVSKADE